MKTAAAALAFTFLVGASAHAGNVRPVVAELYTSQGCSSCIAADALAWKLAQRPDVVFLSFHVTYWDMFGWKDTLGSEENTRRQKAYAASLRHGGVYTPQMIVDGAKDVAGSREDSVSYALELAALARNDGLQPDDEMPAIARKDGYSGEVAIVAGARIKTAARSAWSVGVDLSKAQKKLHVTIDRAPATAKHSNVDATVWLFLVRSNATVKIGGGENNGRVANYRNVVTGIKNIGHWRGDAMSLDLPKPETNTPSFDSVAVVVQQGGYGRVIGAAFMRNVLN